jgi:hypothetical protein
MKVVTVQLIASLGAAIFFYLEAFWHSYNQDTSTAIAVVVFFITLMILRRVLKLKLVVPLTAVATIIVIFNNFRI